MTDNQTPLRQTRATPTTNGWERVQTVLLVVFFTLTSPLWGGCLLQAIMYPVFYAQYGRGPGSDRLHNVKEGMTPAEVVALMGEPHKRHAESDGTATWIYFDDCLSYNYSGVSFGSDGRVAGVWVH